MQYIIVAAGIAIIDIMKTNIWFKVPATACCAYIRTATCGCGNHGYIIRNSVTIYASFYATIIQNIAT